MIFDRAGRLVASTAQEGVIRLLRSPEGEDQT
jgi:acyl-CoA thioesterase